MSETPKQSFVEPTLEEEASLADVTLSSGGDSHEHKRHH